MHRPSGLVVGIRRQVYCAASSQENRPDTYKLNLITLAGPLFVPKG